MGKLFLNTFKGVMMTNSSAEEPAESARQLAAHYTQLARTESEKGLEGYAYLDKLRMPAQSGGVCDCDQQLEGYAYLDKLRVQLMHALELCKKREDWETANSLVWAIQNYLDIQGHWTGWIEALKIGITAAQNLERRYKGLSYSFRYNESAFLGNLGIAYRKLGQMQQAIKYHKQALAIARKTGAGRRQGECVHLGNLGIAYSALGQKKRAIKYFEQALAISREIGDRRTEGNQLGNLGTAYRDLGLANRNRGQVERAIEYYEQALAIAREIGDRGGEGTRLSNLGTAYSALARVEWPIEVPLWHEVQAIEYYEQALAISHDIGDREGEGATWGRLGNAYRVLGEVKQAIEYYERALDIARKIGDQVGDWEGKGAQLAGLGNAYRALGQIEQAKEYLEQALAIFEKTKSPYADQTRNDLAHL